MYTLWEYNKGKKRPYPSSTSSFLSSVWSMHTRQGVGTATLGHVFLLFFFFFFNPHPKICLLILNREEGIREREREIDVRNID